MIETTVVSIRLSAETKKQMIIVAENDQRTISNYVKALIVKDLAKNK